MLFYFIVNPNPFLEIKNKKLLYQLVFKIKGEPNVWTHPVESVKDKKDKVKLRKSF